jgi:hypothetical protein
MPGGTYVVQLNDRELRVTSRDLAMFRDLYLGTSELASRMSELLWLDIHTWETAYGINASEVLQVIQDLEHGETGSRAKPATRFKKPPLKGLWHKHVFSARFIPKNISLALTNGRLRKIVTDVVGTDGSPFTMEKIVELRDRVIENPFRERAAANKLTGEWIVYLAHDAKNYYLCCGAHNDGDQFIYVRIAQHCRRDFPDLRPWMREAEDLMNEEGSSAGPS